MAEYAEEQLEEQLPELQELTASGLLAPEEVTQLLRRRRGLEYRLQKREKRLRDLQAYAQHEVCLLLLLKHRRRAAHYYFKRDRIEAAIVQRLHRLHRQACYRFQHRVDCWLAHASFCEQVGHPQQASKVLARMLQVHSGREDLWLAAADWHWHDRLETRARWLRRKAARPSRKDDGTEKEMKPLGMETDGDEAEAGPARCTASAKDVLQSAQLARAFLLRGLRVHKRSPRLLTALFCLEADLTAWVVDRRADLPAAAGLDAESVAAGEPASLVLETLLGCPGAAGSRDLLARVAAAATACPPLADRVLPDIRDRLAALPEEQQLAPTGAAAVEAAPAEDPEAAAVLRLESALAAGGLRALREAWEAERDSVSAAVRVLRRYIELECSGCSGGPSDDAVSRVRREFERLAGRLGAGSVDFWTSYLRFEDELGDPALVGQLDWRARKFLRPELLNAYNVARLCPQLG